MLFRSILALTLVTGTMSAVEKPSMIDPPPAPKARPQQHRVRLPSGSIVRIRTTTTISTKYARPGDRFSGVLVSPKGTPKGGRVQGVIADSNRGGRIHGRAYLTVRLTAVEINGRMVPVHTDVHRFTARGTKGRDAIIIGSGAGTGAAIGAIAGGGPGAAIGAAAGAGAGTGVVLATRGAPAVIPSESLIAFQLRAPVAVPN